MSELEKVVYNFNIIMEISGKKEKVKSFSRVQLFATLWTVAHQAPPFMGILQAKILEWVAISFSSGSSRPRDRIRISHIAGRLFALWATRKAPVKDGIVFSPFKYLKLLYI